MEIACIILAHKYPKQLIRLIARLDAEQTSFWVHIDQKISNKIYQVIVSRLSNKQNVYFLERQNVYCGHFSQVYATYNGIKEIFQSNIPFDYVKLLSGQDYPIRPRGKIEKTLQESGKSSFLEFFPLPSKVWEIGGERNGGLDRINYCYFHVLNRYFRLPLKRKFPQGFEPFGRSAYWFLPREYAEYINNFIKKNLSFIKFFKNTKIPDESFFQTIICNSPLREKIINDNLTYTDWRWNSPNPEILNRNYFKILFESKCLFARKFDITKDSDALDLIDSNFLSE